MKLQKEHLWIKQVADSWKKGVKYLQQQFFPQEVKQIYAYATKQ